MNAMPPPLPASDPTGSASGAGSPSDLRTEFRLSLSHGRLMLWILGGPGTVMALVGAWLLFTEGGAALALLLPGLFLVWVGWFMYSRPRKDRAPRLVIDPAGIFAPKQAGRAIPWTAIEKVVLAETEGNRQAFLGIDVDDVSNYEPARSSRGALKQVSKLYSGGCEVIVPAHNLDGEIPEIEAAIRRASPGTVVHQR